MAKKSTARAERLKEVFGVSYRMGKARVGLTNLQIANVVGIKAEKTLKKHRENPVEFTLEQLLKMGTLFRWSDDDYLALIRAWSK